MQTQRAESTAALFTRDGEQANNLFDMQVRRLCMHSAVLSFLLQHRRMHVCG